MLRIECTGKCVRGYCSEASNSGEGSKQNRTVQVVRSSRWILKVVPIVYTNGWDVVRKREKHGKELKAFG